LSNTPGTCGHIVNFTDATASDNCAVSVARVLGNASGTFFGVGSEAITYVATDASQLASNCTFSVTIADVEPPSLTCPTQIVRSAVLGRCNAEVDHLWNVTSADNCQGSAHNQVQGPTSGANFSVGDTTVTYVAADSSMLSSSCNITVTVVDEQDPVITCPQNISLLTEQSVCVAQAQFPNATAWDNCGVVSVTQLDGPSSGSPFSKGTTGVRFRAVDSAGRSADCWFYVTVTDNEQPSITCPADITVGTAAGSCDTVVSFPSATTADNCGATAMPISGPANNSAFPRGTSLVTFRATDTSGNWLSCNVSITVEDRELPQFVNCPSNRTVDRDNGKCNATIFFPTPVATDNCQTTTNRTLRSVASTEVTLNVGSSLLQYTSVDTSGNTAVCSFAVTVLDTDNPAIFCPANVSIPNDPDQCGAFVVYDPPATRDCYASTYGSSTARGSNQTFPVGSHLETYIVSNALGINASCSFAVVVSDTQRPRITCPSSTVFNTTPGQCSAVVTYDAPTAVDNCNSVTVVLSSGVGNNTVLPLNQTSVENFTASDCAGNFESCAFTLSVVDNQAPVITCPSDYNVATDANLCTAVVNYPLPQTWDNCGTQPVVLTDGLAPNSPFPKGNTTVTYTVSDASGNTASCSFVVRVYDAQLPMLTCPGNQTLSSDLSYCSALFTYSVSLSDNCPGATDTLTAGLASNTRFPVSGPTRVAYSAVDLSGNQASCDFWVTVNDVEPPTLICPNAITQGTDMNQCSSVVSFTPPVGTDNCPLPTTAQSSQLGPNSEFPLGVSYVNYTTTDTSGQVAICSTQVTIEDRQPPVIS
jgi:large repetitive protein